MPQDVAVSVGASTLPFGSSVHSSSRYLVDQFGAPWLMVGDSPQALVTNLSVNDMTSYLSDRQSYGINCIWADALTDNYVAGVNGNAYTTLDSIAPFTGTTGGAPDMTTPNEAYWARVDTMLNLAAQYGITVMFGVCESGNLQAATWGANAVTNGTTRCTTYGAFLGNRYKSFPNIIWFHGNDDVSEPTAALVAIYTGIKSTTDAHLTTTELGNGTGLSTDESGWAGRVDFNTAYDYYQSYNMIQNGYLGKNSDGTAGSYSTKPVIMGEANYEGEDNAGSGSNAASYSLRNQAWWIMLSGACGYLYGEYYTVKMPGTWASFQASADSEAATELSYMAAFFRARNWHLLVPDAQAHGAGSLVTSGFGTYSSATTSASSANLHTGTYVTAAKTPDGSLGLAYLPHTATVTVDMTQMRGTITARWYDPSLNTFASIGSFSNTGTHNFTSSGTHADGGTDFVLVLDA